MKKIKIVLTSLLVSMFTITNVYAATSDPNSLDNINDSTVQRNNNPSLGYIMNNNFVCYSCGAYYHETGSTTTLLGGPDEVTGGIGVYFKNGDTWETGSYPGSSIATSDLNNVRYPLSSFFVAAAVGNNPTATTTEGAKGIIDKYLLTVQNGKLTKTIDNGAVITVTPEVYSDKNFIKLNYNVKNGSTAQKINVSTFNDIYIGGEPSSSCNDNAAYELNTHIPTIRTGFNAKTGTTDSKKYMTVILEETSGLLNNGGGTFGYWSGIRDIDKLSGIEGDEAKKSFTTSVIQSLFKVPDKDNQDNQTIPSDASPYADSEFSYTWSKDMAANEETTFSTLIGLGNNNPVTINIDENTISPNYDKDNKTFSLTENDANIQIGGTIKDECGMGTCTYTINGSGPIPCDENVYYTSGDSFTTNYMSTINIKDAELKTTGNEYTVTANSVACGTATATHTFNLSGDVAENPQTGINNNYIILGLILVGGVGIFIYSKKHNKFPQV